MRDEMKVFRLLGEASGSIYPLARDVMQPLFAEHFSEQRFYGPTFLAFQLQPEPLTPALMEKRNPYNNPADREEILGDAAEAGLLVRDGTSYTISQVGKKIILDIHQAFYDHVNQVSGYPADNLAELVGLLENLVNASAKSGPDSGLFCFNCSRSGHPPVEEGTLAHVDQLLDDLNAFRDDAHVAAWEGEGLTGPVLEVLTLVWNGEANTAEKLAERLPYRSFQEGDYQAALDELAGKGWVEKGSDGYQVTAEGKKLREGIEEGTNARYFKPWKVLADDRLDQLGSLLEGLIKANQALLAGKPE